MDNFFFLSDLLSALKQSMHKIWTRIYARVKYWVTQKLPHIYILQIKQPSLYGYAKLEYRFAVTSWSPSNKERHEHFHK